MKLKWTLPYILSGASLLGVVPNTLIAQSSEPHQSVRVGTEKLAYSHSASYELYMERQLNEYRLDNKADSLCDTYVSNMLNAQKKLQPLMGKRGYRAAVRAELPGAPVGMHCVFGQYTHLSRALDEMGDTLEIIPDGARTACTSFKQLMQHKYRGDEYRGCIHNGVMHETDSAYGAALLKYLAKNNISATTPDSVRRVYEEKFAKSNFSADALDSGAILIVPRYRGSRSKFHAIMYLGRGYVKSGKFIADAAGRHIYVGHNRENIGDLFRSYDSSYVFAADTRKIARVEYGKELQRIESMSHSELIEFLSGEKYSAAQLRAQPYNTLLRMARNKYFKRVIPNIPAQSAPVVAYNISPYINNIVAALKSDQRTL